MSEQSRQIMEKFKKLSREDQFRRMEAMLTALEVSEDYWEPGDETAEQHTDSKENLDAGLEIPKAETPVTGVCEYKDTSKEDPLGSGLWWCRLQKTNSATSFCEVTRCAKYESEKAAAPRKASASPRLPGDWCANYGSLECSRCDEFMDCWEPTASPDCMPEAAGCHPDTDGCKHWQQIDGVWDCRHPAGLCAGENYEPSERQSIDALSKKVQWLQGQRGAHYEWLLRLDNRKMKDGLEGENG